MSNSKIIFVLLISILLAIFLFVGVNASTYLDEYEEGTNIEQKETIEELSIKLKALFVVRQVEDYLN